MSQPASPTPQDAAKTPEQERLDQLQKEIDKAWGALAEATVAHSRARHEHAKATRRSHEYSPEALFTLAREHRQAEADTNAALETCLLAQVKMMREIDSQTDVPRG